MKKSLFYYLTIIAMLFLSSCGDDDANLNPNAPAEPGEPTVRPTDVVFPTTDVITITSIIGRVIDDSGTPVSGATVTCVSCKESLSVISESDGSFSFQSVENEGEQAYLSVKHSSSFDAYRRMPLIAQRQNYTSIELREKRMQGKLSAGSGGEISLPSGAEVSLPANSILDDAGNIYNGDYNVYMAWIDPMDKNLNEAMMGDLSGIDTDGNLMGLSTFGMLQVELESENGEPLNIAGGEQAELKFPVPAELRSMAPETIPLWSYDETHGYWVEEGSATLIGDMYVGSVTHFSTWNVDAKFDPVDLCGQIQLYSNNQEVGLPFFEVRLSGDSFNSVGGWLCEDGSFNFINIPSGEALTIKVYNYCGELVKTEVVGSISEDTKIDPIIVTDQSGLNEVFVSGNALTCGGAPVTNGTISVVFDNRTLNFPLDSDGTFQFAVPTCGNLTGTMTILNLDDFSNSVPLQISSVNSNYTLPDIALCDENEEYYYLEVLDELAGNSEPDLYLVTDPNNLGYRFENGAYYFDALLDDGTGNQSPLTFKFSQELKLNEVIQGTAQDGYVDTASTSGENLIPGDGLSFIFTEIGPLNADGIPEVIQGSFEGLIVPDFESLGIKTSFRLKPL